MTAPGAHWSVFLCRAQFAAGGNTPRPFVWLAVRSGLTCGLCGIAIHPGESFTRVRGGRSVRCYSCRPFTLDIREVRAR